MKHSKTKLLLAGVLLAITTSFNACKEDKLVLNPNTITKPNVNFVGLTNSTSTIPSQIIRYNSGEVTKLIGPALAITGLQSGESITAIDFRPSTGALYGLGSTRRLYLIPIPTSATASSTTAKVIGNQLAQNLLGGTVAGFDFDPVTDRIRVTTSGTVANGVITNNGQNVLINPEDGTAVAETDINGIAGAFLTGAAYTNNTFDATSTTLYNLDVVNQKLYKQDQPGMGTITEVGSTGLIPIINNNASFSTAYNTNITNARVAAGGGFDVSPSGVALAVFMNNSAPAIPIDGIVKGTPASAASAVAGTPTLFQIDLKTGRAVDLGVLPLPAPPSGAAAGTAIIGLAINTSPVAYAVDDANNLLIFNPSKLAQPVTRPITGFAGGDKILNIDFNPNNGKLYALGSKSLYTISIVNGGAVATAIGGFTTAFDANNFFGFDFDPVGGLIRVINNTTGTNMTINSATGAINTAFPSLVIATGNPPMPTSTIPNISGIAYNNTATAASSVLYGIDYTSDKLYKIDPSTGYATNVGPLGINVESGLGFSIGTTSNNGYGIFKVGTAYKLYTINLLAGSATFVADFPNPVRGITLGLGF